MCLNDFDDHVLDKDVIGKNAKTKAERRQVLDNALNAHWVNQDIGKIRRYEDDDDYYYALWKYPNGAEKS